MASTSEEATYALDTLQTKSDPSGPLRILEDGTPSFTLFGGEDTVSYEGFVNEAPGEAARLVRAVSNILFLSFLVNST